jgi:hypothetical protein
MSSIRFLLTSELDFRAYLTGRIVFVAMINPQRARKLKMLFDRIVWKDEVGRIINNTSFRSYPRCSYLKWLR